MTGLNVPGMSCGHCTAAIETAIKTIDPAAKASCDLGARIFLACFQRKFLDTLFARRSELG